MSIASEEFMISQERNSEKSSSVEDSLTAKLDNMLHSSDDIVVENADFFKASSNEMTEIEEVGDLPQSDSHSVPKLDLDEHGRASNPYLEYKSSESYTSLGTVVRHETPKIGQRKIKVIKPSRPQSAKNRSNSYRPKENINSKELVSCLQKIALKNPEFTKLIKHEKNDFEKIFHVKVKEFRDLIEANAFDIVSVNKEKLKLKNKQKERKREEIRCKLQEEELERIRISNMKYEENCRNKLKDIVEATLKKYQTIKMIEDCKFSKEIEQKKMKQKNTIIENIKNYYDNKMNIIREKMLERKSYKQIFDLEHKLIYAEAEKSRKEERKMIHEKNKNLLKKQIEHIELDAKLEVDTIFKKIIKLYKKSGKIMTQHV